MKTTCHFECWDQSGPGISSSNALHCSATSLLSGASVDIRGLHVAEWRVASSPMATDGNEGSSCYNRPFHKSMSNEVNFTNLNGPATYLYVLVSPHRPFSAHTPWKLQVSML